MKKVFLISALFLLILKPLPAFTADKVVIIPLGNQKPTGDAEATDVLEGKTFSNVDNVDLTGVMPNKGAVSIDPSISDQTIPEGYHNGLGIVKGDTKLVADNIKDGVSIFGVTGKYKGNLPYRGALQGCRMQANEQWGWTLPDCDSDCDLYSQLNTTYDTDNLLQNEANIAASHCKDYCAAISVHLGLLHTSYPDGFVRAYDYMVELCEIYNP